MKRKKLVIISHTEHYLQDGAVVGWGPTVNEINHIAPHWEEVVHVASFHESEAPKSCRKYSQSNIRFVPLRPTGGPGLVDKLGILLFMPAVIWRVLRSLRGATEVQFRAPTGIGVFLLPVLSLPFFRKYVIWTKYAGNWAQLDAPLGYRFQRWWLRKNLARCKVTINGFWKDQPEHCISFQNPCLTELQIEEGRLAQQTKRYSRPFRFAFVGRLEDEKGVSRILGALEELGPEFVEVIDFVGDGPKRSEYLRAAEFLGDRVTFHGFIDSADVHEILSRAHFLLLPSTASEGFPKVIAEAACYGCVPIVSDVSSIGHYVKDQKNGLVWAADGDTEFVSTLSTAVNSSPEKLGELSLEAMKMASAFTFERYLQDLEKLVFSQPGPAL